MADEGIYDEDTLRKVYAGLEAAGVTGQQAIDAVNQMLNEGILFRERAPESDEHHPESDDSGETS